MRHGIVILPQSTWADARHRWQQAEKLGFDHAWTYDHLSWRSLSDEPWHATIPTLTAAATVTSRIRLGTFVASPNFRHPVPFAKELATVDDIAGGRMLLGVGSGGVVHDTQVLGQQELSAGQRHERFVEFVDGLDSLLRFEPDASGGVSFAGEWYVSRGARMVGRPAQAPRMPLLVAANGPKGLNLVASKADGWITTGRDVETEREWWRTVAELTTRLEDALGAHGRDPVGFDRYLSLDSSPAFSFTSVSVWEDTVARAAALGFTDVVAHWPRTDGVFSGSEDVLGEVASTFQR